MTRNIITVTWPEESRAYQGLSELKSLSSTRIHQAAVVARTEDGRVQLREGGNAIHGLGTLGGGALGSLIGILGGPLGVLLGFTTGALFGSLIDLSNTADDGSVLARISAQLRPGVTALVADIDEDSVDLVDKLAAVSGGTLTRHAYDEVLAEVANAEQAAQAAADQAAKVLREQKKTEHKADLEKRWEETKSKFKAFFDGK